MPGTLVSIYLCAAVRVNETDTFADEDGANDEYFDFEDISGARMLKIHICSWLFACLLINSAATRVTEMVRTVCACLFDGNIGACVQRFEELASQVWRGSVEGSSWDTTRHWQAAVLSVLGA